MTLVLGDEQFGFEASELAKRMRREAVERVSEMEKKLEEQASELQQSINDSNVIGNEFNRQEAEAKIAMDFINNDHLIK